MRRPLLRAVRTLRRSPPYTPLNAEARIDPMSPAAVGANLYISDRLPTARELQSDSLSESEIEVLLSLLVLHPTLSASVARSAFGSAPRHALLFTSLRHPACDVRLSAGEAAGMSFLSSLLVECVERIRHDVWGASPSPLTNSHADVAVSAEHIQLVDALVYSARHQKTGLAAAERMLREALATTTTIPESVLTSLLSLPAAPEVLHTLLVHVLAHSTGGAVDAPLFRVLLSALLNNDNFFSSASASHDAKLPDGESGLVRMDRVLRATVLHGVSLQAQSVGGFDYISVRWTPLMNKWARVYTKQNEGELLYSGFQSLLDAVPAAEAKIPASFYIRLIGALIDRGSALSADNTVVDEAAAGERLWDKVVLTARRAVRLFGRHPPELRAIWIVLMKAALTLPARHTHGTRRLLEAYRLCAEQDHPVPVDRAATMQLMRLTSESILSRWADASDSAGGALTEAEVALRTCERWWVVPLCDFMRAYTTVSFLWLLDGIGMVVAALWAAHGLNARPLAAALCDTLISFLQQHGVTGVSLSNNPGLAAAMDSFQLGERTAFWWQCGCGARLASASKRCVECLRRSGGSVWWTCSSCGSRQGAANASTSAGGRHENPRESHCAACQGPHPRLQAALAHDRQLCLQCGEVTSSDGKCCRCDALSSQQASTVCCDACGLTHSSNALYCPQCFHPNPNKPLRIWLCDGCGHFNLSTWSHCQTCSDRTTSRRGTHALTAAFLPWRCGCGAPNHPCRTTCTHCSVNGPTERRGGGRSCYTCPGCRETSSVRVRERVLLTTTALAEEHESAPTLNVYLCEHCDQLHPRDALVLYTSSVSRHCLVCGGSVAPRTYCSTDGSFVHCHTIQSVNELYPFRCDCKVPSAEASTLKPPLQTGYECRHCGQARPELRGRASPQPFYVWRCLREVGEDFHLCGAWNYSWRHACAACHGGRVMSTVGECQARAEAWQCPVCHHHNRPTDVLLCGGCGRGLHQIAPCPTCGSPHLTLACH